MVGQGLNACLPDEPDGTNVSSLSYLVVRMLSAALRARIHVIQAASSCSPFHLSPATGIPHTPLWVGNMKPLLVQGFRRAQADSKIPQETSLRTAVVDEEIETYGRKRVNSARGTLGNGEKAKVLCGCQECLILASAPPD